MSVDAHCHLTDLRFAADLGEVMGRAAAAGVQAAVSAGTSLENSRDATVIALRYPALFAAVGIHPGEAHLAPPDFPDILSEMARLPKVVAIGEIGLDHHHPTPHRSAQEKVFLSQLALARTLGLPAVIHSRKAEREALELVRKSGVRRALFHCYTGDLDTARAIADEGFLIGVTGIATFGDPAYSAMVAGLPLECLVAETDSPYLAPAPFRGKRNEPAHLGLVARKVASIFHGLHEDEVLRKIENTAKNFFGI